MSGGHWNYKQYIVQDFLEDVSDSTLRRFPKLSQVHSDMAILFKEIWHSLDWDFSGDKGIEDDQEFEKYFIEELGRIISKKYKLRVYEVNETKEN
jgi:hypothetical protein